jgi:hypothetical protein
MYLTSGFAPMASKKRLIKKRQAALGAMSQMF